MIFSHHRHRRRISRVERDALRPSLTQLLNPNDRRGWREIEDRREFTPAAALVDRPARSVVGRGARLVPGVVVRKRPESKASYRMPLYKTGPLAVGDASGPASSLAFRSPRRVLVCIRRRMRREVLHALELTGRKGANVRRRRYNEWSFVECKER